MFLVLNFNKVWSLRLFRAGLRFEKFIFTPENNILPDLGPNFIRRILKQGITSYS